MCSPVHLYILECMVFSGKAPIDLKKDKENSRLYTLLVFLFFGSSNTDTNIGFKLVSVNNSKNISIYIFELSDLSAHTRS